jgi:capsular polysaccharide export protein
MRRASWGFSWRKRRLLAGFVGAPVARLAPGQPLDPGDELYVWGTQAVPEWLADGVHVLRVEDGFLRSVGLGAALARPASWVIDPLGLHYDPSRPSRLETILCTAEFEAVQLQRARRTRMLIVRHGLSKYNLPGRAWRRPTCKNRETILVTGQVASDASLRCGAIGPVSSNNELLRAVRREHPDAYVVYKRHPDVHLGLRDGDDSNARDWADEVVADADITHLLAQVDRVHVLTSLAGFEALLRNVPVTCHGMPFYAGWGLTDDRVAIDRRQRVLSVDQLVAGALLSYPTYVHPTRRIRVEVEDVIEALCAPMTLRQRLSQKLAACAMRLTAKP